MKKEPLAGGGATWALAPLWFVNYLSRCLVLVKPYTPAPLPHWSGRFVATWGSAAEPTVAHLRPLPVSEMKKRPNEPDKRNYHGCIVMLAEKSEMVLKLQKVLEIPSLQMKLSYKSTCIKLPGLLSVKQQSPQVAAQKKRILRLQR